jgi:hypothetical protein
MTWTTADHGTGIRRETAGPEEGGHMTERMTRLFAWLADERGEVNTAAILAWTVLAVVAIAAINVVFDDLVTSVFSDVKERILGIG